jgi:alkylhydroperoxidase family enzyme
MHSNAALAAGESPDRLAALTEWRGSALFTERERVALRLTEDLTLLTDQGVPDATHAEVASHFSETERGALLFVIVNINAWNRLMVGIEMPIAPKGQQAS